MSDAVGPFIDHIFSAELPLHVQALAQTLEKLDKVEAALAIGQDLAIRRCGEIRALDPHDLKGPWRLERRDETLPSEPNEVADRSELESVPELPSSDGSPSRGLGRPSKSAEIERATEILLANGVTLPRMPRPNAYIAVRQCPARELGSDTQIGFSDPVIQRSLFKRFGRDGRPSTPCVELRSETRAGFGPLHSDFVRAHNLAGQRGFER